MALLSSSGKKADAALQPRPPQARGERGRGSSATRAADPKGGRALSRSVVSGFLRPHGL